MASHDKNTLPASAQNIRFPVRQFLLLCIPVAVTIFAIAFAFSDMRFTAQLDHIVAAERTHLNQLGGYVAADVSTSLIHLRALAQEPAVTRALDSPNHFALQELQSVFMTMANRNPTYQEIRWIDQTGVERVRVTREGDRVLAVDAQDLQDTSDRYYFTATRDLLTGEVYISHLDLNVEDYQIGSPVRPILRVATPVQGSDNRMRGILIINITMRHMIAALRSASETSPDTNYALINKYGYWLTVPARQDLVPFQLEVDSKISREHPAAWDLISANYTGTAELEDGFWIWQKLAAEDIVRRVVLAESDRGIEIPVINHSDFSLLLVAHKPARVLAGLRSETRMTAMLFATLLMLAFAWGLLFLLRGQMMEKRAEIKVAYAMAHADQMERLKELEERFHLLVEASDVGMIVVDEAGVILMSNTSAEKMLGYPAGGLQGLSVDNLLPPAQRSQHTRMRAGYLQHPEVRKMGAGRKLEALTADGRRIPVEVGLNPYLDHGKQVVLASIIDLSK
ncbi:MAG: PAS domain S-box protein [Gammaproteobacteria bacterium]|jgi:PAS domain S-box-containing protein